MQYRRVFLGVLRRACRRKIVPDVCRLPRLWPQALPVSGAAVQRRHPHGVRYDLWNWWRDLNPHRAMTADGGGASSHYRRSSP